MEPWFYENLCRILGREDFIPFQWGATEEKTKEMFSAFAEIFRTKTRDEWFDLLSQNEICAAKVYNLDEVPTDPQLLHRNMVVELDHPTFGKVRQAGISVKLSDTPGTIRSFAPLPGQHTDEVLMNLGHSKERIKELRNEGVIA